VICLSCVLCVLCLAPPCESCASSVHAPVMVVHLFLAPHQLERSVTIQRRICVPSFDSCRNVRIQNQSKRSSRPFVKFAIHCYQKTGRSLAFIFGAYFEFEVLAFHRKAKDRTHPLNRLSSRLFACVAQAPWNWTLLD
jgi:hypothetical protein